MVFVMNGPEPSFLCSGFRKKKHGFHACLKQKGWRREIRSYFRYNIYIWKALYLRLPSLTLVFLISVALSFAGQL